MRLHIPALLLVFAVFVGGMVGGSAFTLSAYAAGRGSYGAWHTLASAFHEIQTRYVEPLDQQQMVWAAIRGLTSLMDGHSEFLDPDQWRAILEQEQETWHGLGLRVEESGGRLAVVEVLDDSPAHRGGVQPGDLLVMIEGREVSTWDDVGLLTGARGEPVDLVLLRGQEELPLTLVRDLVHVPAVKAEAMDGVLYVALLHFREGSAREVANAVAVAEESGPPPRGLVLDLRDNPGGLLREAVAVADLFLEEGVVVELVGRQDDLEVLRSTTSGSDNDIPMVVLVNGATVSAAELVAGALKERGRATLMGTTTYGKASVQGVWSFEDGSALRMTTGMYYLPGGVAVDTSGGVAPHVEVLAPADEERRATMDEVARVLENSNHLSQAARATLVQEVRASLRPVPSHLHREALGRPWQERLDADPQLRAAFRHLTQDPTR